MIPDSHRDILAKSGFAHVATIGPDGEPQSSPVWYDWDGEHFLFSQTKGRQKYRNVQREARVAVSITDPDNPYRYLEIRARSTASTTTRATPSSMRWPRSTSTRTSTPGPSRGTSASW